VALGTDNGKALVDYLRGHLKKTEFLLGTEVVAIEKHNDNNFQLVCRRDKKRTTYNAQVILAARGAAALTGFAMWPRN